MNAGGPRRGGETGGNKWNDMLLIKKKKQKQKKK